MRNIVISLIERALLGTPRPLEFYLREQSRLPGPRANLELTAGVANLLTTFTSVYPDDVRTLVKYLVGEQSKTVTTNTPDEFVVLCGIVAAGACAAAQPTWRGETFELLDSCVSSSAWRVREGVVLAFQRLLPVAPQEALPQLMTFATEGKYFQQRAAVAAIAEPALLQPLDLIEGAFSLHQIVLERLRQVPVTERKREDFRSLRQTLGYTLSVVTAATPEEGFALMRTCAAWGDADMKWILRENLKKKRLAKFVEDTETLARLLA